MQIGKVYAVVSTAQLEKAAEWYGRLFGRAADDRPMAGLCEWYAGAGGVQVVEDPRRAGSSMLTVFVTDLAGARTDLQARGITLGATSPAKSGVIAQVNDPDGNIVTVVEPGPAQGSATAQR